MDRDGEGMIPKHYLTDPAAIVDRDKLTEIWETGIVETQNGRSFLGSLLALPTFQLTAELHNYLKNHLLVLPKSKVAYIGKLYLKAWKTADAERRDVLEETCMQDLIRCSLVTKHQVASYCLEALRPFAEQRQFKNIESMIYKLSEPLIWRALEAGNKEINYNAISFLLLTFPLRNDEQSPLEHLEFLQRQLEVLKKYLFNDVEEIRVMTVTGVCQLINLYWDIIPATDIRYLLLKLCNDLAWDANSVSVRTAVYNGMRVVMENPRSHVTLESLLPKLAKGIHDRSESVRSTFVQMLLQTRSLKTLKYWKIVSMDQIILRLAAEQSPSICERLVELTLAAYFPVKQTDDVRLDRTIMLFKQNMAAARKFYQYCSKFVSTNIAVDQIMLFLRCIYGCVRRAQDEENAASNANTSVSSTCDNRVDQTPDRVSNDKSDECDLNVSDAPVIVGFLDCAAILWNSIGPELAKGENKPMREKLHKTGGGLILKFVQFFDDSVVLDAILVLVGLMTKAASRYFSGSLMKKMKAIDDEGFDPKLHGSLVETLCHIQLKEIVSIVGKWWRNFDSLGSSKGGDTSPPTKAKRVRISVPEPEDVSKPRLGVQIVSYLLNRPSTRKYIVNSHVDQLRELESELEGMSDHCMSMSATCYFNASWVVEILKLRATIVNLLCAKEGGTVESSKFLASLMDLLRVNVWPRCNDSVDEGDGDSNNLTERATAAMRTSLTIWSDFVMCGLCDDKATIVATDLTLMTMTQESFVAETAQLIYHILDRISNHGLPTEAAVVLRPWFDRTTQFTTSEPNAALFGGMDEVKQLTEKFEKIWCGVN